MEAFALFLTIAACVGTGMAICLTPSRGKSGLTIYNCNKIKETLGKAKA